MHGIRERLAFRQPDKPPLEGAPPRDGSVIEEENHQRQQRRDHEREDLEHTGLRSDSSWAEELHASIEKAGSETKWQVPAPHSKQEVCGSEAELPGSIFAKTALRFQDTPAGIAARMGVHTRSYRRQLLAGEKAGVGGLPLPGDVMMLVMRSAWLVWRGVAPRAEREFQVVPALLVACSVEGWGTRRSQMGRREPPRVKLNEVELPSIRS